MRSSWQRLPIDGIGRDCGIDSRPPRWSCPSRYPASSLDSRENGGDLTSPCSHTKGFSRMDVNFDIDALDDQTPSSRSLSAFASSLSYTARSLSPVRIRVSLEFAKPLV